MTRLLSISSMTSWASLLFFIHPHTHSSSRLIWLPPKHHGLSRHTPMFLLQTHPFFISYFLVWLFTFYSFFRTHLNITFSRMPSLTFPPLAQTMNTLLTVISLLLHLKTTLHFFVERMTKEFVRNNFCKPKTFSL